MQPTTSAPAHSRHRKKHTHTDAHAHGAANKVQGLLPSRSFDALKDLLVGTPGYTVCVCQEPLRAKQTVSETLENMDPRLQTPSYYQIRYNCVFFPTEMKDT